MGHIHLGTLPQSRSWRDVVELLQNGMSVATVVSASAKAAEQDMARAATEPVFVEAVRLLLSIPLAARQKDFGNALFAVGIDVVPEPSLFDILSAATARLDMVGRAQPGRSDAADLATRALSKALLDCIGSDLPSLFGPSAEDVRLSFRKFSFSAGIAELTRSYFGAVVGTSLSYWLDRVLALQTGSGQRFASIRERARFDQDLGQYTYEVTRIIREFSGGWYGKTVHDKGAIGTAEARDFSYGCVKKMIDELKVRRDSDA